MFYSFPHAVAWKKAVSRTLPGTRHCGDAPAAGVVRNDEDHAWPSESGRGLCAGEEEGAGNLAGDRLQEHPFVCGERRLPRGEYASWLRARGDERRAASSRGVLEVQEDYRHWRERTGAGDEAQPIDRKSVV